MEVGNHVMTLHVQTPVSSAASYLTCIDRCSVLTGRSSNLHTAIKPSSARTPISGIRIHRAPGCSDPILGGSIASWDLIHRNGAYLTGVR